MGNPQYKNISGFVGESTGKFSEKVKELKNNSKTKELEHLDEVLSVIDMNNERHNDWLTGEYEHIMAEIDLVYLLRSEYGESVEINKSPKGTKKDFDIFVELNGSKVWIEVKYPQMMDVIRSGGRIPTDTTSNKIWNYIRTSKFEKIGDLVGENEILILSVYSKALFLQNTTVETHLSETAPNWTKYIDGVFLYNCIGDIRFQGRYVPITELGEDAEFLFNNINTISISE